MNIPIVVANLLTLLAFVIHTFIGDKELRLIEPQDDADEKKLKLEKWTMARSGWHWISFDLLLATFGLGLVNFTDFFEDEQTLLRILAVYFLGYGIVWFIGLAISREFPKKYLKLGQWMLLLAIGTLIYLGTV
ncbi:MAG: hypothetical protein AAF348_05270 [Bacteroidota bacterium]